MDKPKPRLGWRRVGKRIFDSSKGIIVLLLIINSFRFGLFGFIVVVLLLLVLVYFTQKELIMNTAEQFQYRLWGKHMTIQDLKGKKVKFVFGRGNKNVRKIEDVKVIEKE